VPPLNVVRLHAATGRREEGLLAILPYETECEGWPVRVLYALYLRRKSGLVLVLSEVSSETDPATFLDDYNAAHDEYRISVLPGYQPRHRTVAARIRAWIESRRELIGMPTQP
jgi:hypothetical protein